MRKNIITLFCCSLMLAACGNQTKIKEDMNFVDNVKTALADSGRIDLNSLLSLPERQRPRIADEDTREILQFCGKD